MIESSSASGQNDVRTWADIRQRASHSRNAHVRRARLEKRAQGVARHLTCDYSHRSRLVINTCTDVCAGPQGIL